MVVATIGGDVLRERLVGLGIAAWRAHGTQGRASGTA